MKLSVFMKIEIFFKDFFIVIYIHVQLIHAFFSINSEEVFNFNPNLKYILELYLLYCRYAYLIHSLKISMCIALRDKRKYIVNCIRSLPVYIIY